MWWNIGVYGSIIYFIEFGYVGVGCVIEEWWVCFVSSYDKFFYFLWVGCDCVDRYIVLFYYWLWKINCFVIGYVWWEGWFNGDWIIIG